MPRNPILAFPIVDPTLIVAAIETIRLADSIDLASFPCEAGPDRDDCAIHDNALLDEHRGNVTDAAVAAALFLSRIWEQINQTTALSAKSEPESETPCP